MSTTGPEPPPNPPLRGPSNSSASSSPQSNRTEGLGGSASPLSWAAILAASLLVAIAYGVVFASSYRQPIDAQGGIVFFLLGFLTVLACRVWAPPPYLTPRPSRVTRGS